ncbi:putative pyridine nucleotide-disulfide oxidoreductase [Actinoplanes missouriensis 431]|uniref:Putative pyridine nucleotide-disulfide oxidoreductase n=1 Tax=Actinoplanes missouriensis (strain ATCC 14538 / DSM 43046 / CBS 188.64 / JCM 3121 / NBRC 102363 / NCIMB 12654 / NRRL B-3342 / UNCC 431) TaxID=512565 RepID=I0H6Q4_ACTM4|nr:NAD(P)/FAD-dependent oxidoreductase [Actinoplanes missouriensis]BAL88691.1 putative pyridine nucleotide-disulfide oxidoreductase [Actinoplanes missouriensis 431]
MTETVEVADPVEVDVVVVGAGLAGIGAAIELAARDETFVVLERAADVGGTWRDNTYPGVACDVPSHLYAFAHSPNPGWSRTFAPGHEIHTYLRGLAARPGVAPHLRLGHEVTAAVWDSSADRWDVTTNRGRFRSRVLVLAAGRLTEPRIPGVPGLDGFDGPVFHSARWDHDAKLDGARVGVVGTGASAVQIVPELAGRVEHLTVFARSNPYIIPRNDQAQAAAEPAEISRVREEVFAGMEQGIAARRRERAALDELRSRALGHLAAQVPDPVLRARLTPDYEVGCKRVLLSDTFYPAMNRADVTLAGALQRLDGRTAIAADGRCADLDVLVLATGFHATRQPYAERITGRGGVLLARAWERGMVSHASTVVHGFPNMFVLDGPNAALGHNSAVHVIESQLSYLTGALDHLAGHGGVLEVTSRAQDQYTRDIDTMAERTVWLRGGCTSWYVDARSGRLTLLWPSTATAFRERNGRFDPAPFVAADS